MFRVSPRKVMDKLSGMTDHSGSRTEKAYRMVELMRPPAKVHHWISPSDIWISARRGPRISYNLARSSSKTLAASGV